MSLRRCALGTSTDMFARPLPPQLVNQCNLRAFTTSQVQRADFTHVVGIDPPEMGKRIAFISKEV